MAVLLKQEEKAIFALRELYHRYGYTRFKMSKFEAYDLYMQNKDFLVSDGIITFTDTDGKLMALKPDVTLSIVKNYRQDKSSIQKVYYNENVYRIAGVGDTYRELMQTGLECMGEIGLYEISEVILLAARSLAAISDRFMLDISHMGIVSDLIRSLNLSFDQQRAVLMAIRDKNEDALDTYPLLRKIVNTCGPVSEVLPLLKDFCTTDEAAAACAELEVIAKIMERNGFGEYVQLDFSIVNDMNYYNGIVFRGYIDGIPTGVLAGGQYDQLMKKMGKSASGIGFAVYLDQLERLNTWNKEYDADTVLLYDDSADVVKLSEAAESLSSDGKTVLMLKKKPDDLRCGMLMRFENGRIDILEKNG